MTGFEVIVRPVVFPNIRPAPQRVLAPVDNPEQGLVTLTGGGAKWVGISYGWSVSVTRDAPHKEVKRQYAVERVYQMDEDGNINKENFIDIERLKKIKVKTPMPDGTLQDTKLIYKDPPKRDNVKLFDDNLSRGGEQPDYDPGVGGGGGGGPPG